MSVLSPSPSEGSSQYFEKVKVLAIRQFENYESPMHTFHNQKLAENLHKNVLKFHHAFPEADLELTSITAWLLHLGFTKSFSNGAEKSKELAEEILKKVEYPNFKTIEVLDIISGVFEYGVTTKNGSFLMEAYNAMMMGSQFFHYSRLYKIEKESFEGIDIPNLEWFRYEMEKLKSVIFRSQSGHLYIEPLVAENIRVLKKKIENAKKALVASSSQINKNRSSEIDNNPYKPKGKGDFELEAFQISNRARTFFVVNSVVILGVFFYLFSSSVIVENKAFSLISSVLMIMCGCSALVLLGQSFLPKHHFIYRALPIFLNPQYKGDWVEQEMQLSDGNKIKIKQRISTQKMLALKKESYIMAVRLTVYGAAASGLIMVFGVFFGVS